MKKLILSLSLFLSISSLAHAQWALNGTNIYNTNGGNVGIGTQTPSNYFHGGNNKLLEIFNLNTTINSQSHIILSTGATVDGSSAGTLTWVSKSSTGVQGMAYIGSILQGDATTNAAGKIVFATSNGSTLSQKMLIDKDGNVGIGTIAPTTKLDLTGGFTSRVSGAAGDNSNLTIFNANAKASSNDTRGTIWLDNDGQLKIRSVTGYGTAFRSTSNSFDILNISDNGLVIGAPTMPSGYKLAVNGSAIATSMTVKLNSAWPDYVFKKDYQLPSLQAVKTYIDQNQHLPEIPSEQQIAKDGLNLGEMNKLLVKKVEELTLYLIEKDHKEKEQGEINKIQETRLKTQQDQIDQLKKTVEQLINTIK